MSKTPRNMIRIDTSHFEFAHGHKPKGRGRWGFGIGNRDELVFIDGSFADAKKEAVKVASDRGALAVFVGA